jgi:hypothetical protein
MKPVCIVDGEVPDIVTGAFARDARAGFAAYAGFSLPPDFSPPLPVVWVKRFATGVYLSSTFR